MTANDYLVIAMFTTFITLLLSGVPVAYSLWGTGLLFTLVGWGSDLYLGTDTGLGFNFLGMGITRLYKVMSNWVLVALPMFILMGLMLERSGVAERLMRSAQELFGPVRGGLAVTTALIGVLLAASTGIVGASVVLLGMLSLPTMLEQGYQKELALGTIAGAGTLGILIPPSIMLVVMADQLVLSVGDLFLGAFFPGVILAVLYVVYIMLTAYLRPRTAPLAPDRRPVRLSMLWGLGRDILPPAILIVAVLGSIFIGLCTVTEASGVGCLAATLLTLFSGKLSYRVVKDVLVGTFNTSGYIFGILVGANVFALVLRGLGGDESVERMLTALPLGPVGLVFFLMFCVFILGFFLDWVEITLIILPLVAPVVSSLDIAVEGYGVVGNPKLVWFAILIAVTLQTSFLTPPVGFSLFYLKGICPSEINLGHLYRGVIPFIMLQIVAVLVVFWWPDLVTWLPGVAYQVKAGG
ncbi:MAG: TRAP transporter large permease subunit [Deltaproteobacteria bacterium]|nr:TRAP transporter large permease subunit [Deltaproteobacteria bacterium]